MNVTSQPVGTRAPLDHVVVGAGVIGSSIAYHLSQAGARVLLADLSAPQYPSASWASAGGVRTQRRDPREWQLTQEAQRRWPLLETELGADFGFRAGGHLQVTTSDTVLRAMQARVEREAAGGILVELIDGEAARRLAPILSDAVVGGTYVAGDGQADPRRLTAAFQAAAIRNGALMRSARISDLLIANGHVEGVRFGDEAIGATAVVVAAGSWTPALTHRAGVALPLRVEALQMLLTDPSAPALAPTLGGEELLISLKQLPSGQFLIGGGWPADFDADAHTCRLRPDSVNGSWETALSLAPSLRDRHIADRWCGLEAFSIDGAPFIGPVLGLDGLYIAAGFSGHGFQISPAVGRAVADDLGGRHVPELSSLRTSRASAFQPAAVQRFIADRANYASRRALDGRDASTGRH